VIPLRVLNVIGSSRDLVKVAPIVSEMRRSRQIEPIIVHAGQPERDLFSGDVVRDLQLPRPHVVLGVEPGSAAKQTAAIMERFEDVIASTDPDLVLVVGDVNSSVAASMTAVKRGVPVAHVDAGLRSFDRRDPKEINRVMADAIADFLFVSEESSLDNLICEGISPSRIHFIGNLLIETLYENANRILESTVVRDLDLAPGGYAVLVLRALSDLGGERHIAGIIEALEKIQSRVAVVVSAQMDTMAQLHRAGLWDPVNRLENVKVIGPITYLDFMALLKASCMVLTDATGVQEETTALRVPCLTLAQRSKRPVTISAGTNRLAGPDPHDIVAQAMRILGGEEVDRVPPMWDGRAARRLVARLLDQREEVLDRYRHLRITSQCSAMSDQTN